MGREYRNGRVTQGRTKFAHEGIEVWIDQDELVEVTPDAVRLRKAILQCNRRPKREAPGKG